MLHRSNAVANADRYSAPPECSPSRSGAATPITVFHSVTGGPSVDKPALHRDVIQHMHAPASAGSATGADDLPGARKLRGDRWGFEVIATVT
jgi:hypothetical protein